MPAKQAAVPGVFLRLTATMIYDSSIDTRRIGICRLNNPKDAIEFMDGGLDVTGWDLRKALVLLKKSNIALIERFQSPVAYYENEFFKKDFIGLIQEYYSPTAAFYHHYSLATKFWEEAKRQRRNKAQKLFLFGAVIVFLQLDNKR